MRDKEAEFNQRLCDERHGQIQREFNAVWDTLKNHNRKLWGIIILLLLNLTAVSVVGFFVKAMAK